MPQKKLKTEFRSQVTLSAPFAAWLEKMIEPVPEDRFQSAREALWSLRDPKAHAPPKPSRTRTALLLGVLAVIVAAGGAFVWYTESHDPRSIASRPVLPVLPERPPDMTFPALTWVRTIPAHFNPVKGVAFTRDGSKLFTGGFDGAVKEWEVRTGQAVRALPGHTGRVAAIRVTRDGRFVVSAGDQTVRIWNAGDGTHSC